MKLLLGLGGGDDSSRALEATVERVRETGDDLTVAVIDDSDAETDREAVAERARERLAAAGVDGDVRLLAGDPGGALVDLAESEGFDRIVLGGGETSPLGKVRLGTVREFVVLNANVTVTLVR